MNSKPSVSRRQWMAAGCVGVGGAVVSRGGNGPGGDLWAAGQAASGGQVEASGPAGGAAAAVRFCFNTSCLRGRSIPIMELVKSVAEAGYDGIEVWIDELDRHVAAGGNLADLGRLIADLGLRVEGAIAFANWLVEDPAQADGEFEKARRDMEKVALIGGRAIAAPPVGQNDRPISDWDFAAERLARLGRVGRQVGVVPQLELWGFSQAIGNLQQLLQLAARTDSRDFGLLLDVYHLYKGGSPLNGLRLVSGSSMALFHINDYPATPDRGAIADKDRVFPGDGVAPLAQIFRDLEAGGFNGALSLELFNPDYWQQDPLWVLQTGLRKSRTAWEARHSP
jgi:sugar phosphate isomerase/epimerase